MLEGTEAIMNEVPEPIISFQHKSLYVYIYIYIYIHTHIYTGCSGGNVPDFGRMFLNPLTPNDHYSGRTALLTSKCCILYIYSTNTGTEYFKHGIYSPFLSLQNAVCFIILTNLVPVLFTFYTLDMLKLKKK